MIQNSSGIFYPLTPANSFIPKELTQPILESIFIHNNYPVILVLTEHHIVAADSKTKKPLQFCPLVFETKFETQQIPSNTEKDQIISSLILENQNTTEKVTFLCQDAAILLKWTEELEKRINQRNFHSLFKAKKKIGKGAFATVYLAERLRDGINVAVKAFSKEKQYSGEKGKESLKNQIQLMRSLNHKNIMKLYGVYQTENSIYVILEHMEGLQLNQLFKKHTQMKKQEARQIIKQILSALKTLSQHRIIHRDLKPENIMFKSANSLDLAICDFGLATFADEPTYLFVRCGTPGFVAPEIINIKDMSTKSQPISDMFSAGIIFHYLLFGCSIFPGKKYNDILTQNRACQFNFKKQMYQTADPSAVNLLMKMLEVNPNNRITAESALQHQFFNNSMDCQQQSYLKTAKIPKMLPKGSFKQNPDMQVEYSTTCGQTLRPPLRY